MPVYSTLCPGCLAKDTIYRKIAERDHLPDCRKCGMTVERVIDKPFVQPEIAPYTSPNGGRVISSRAERRDDLARSNAYEWEPGIERDIARKKEEQIAESFAPIAAAVDETVAGLVSAGMLES